MAWWSIVLCFLFEIVILAPKALHKTVELHTTPLILSSVPWPSWTGEREGEIDRSVSEFWNKPMVRSGHPNAVILNIRGYLVIKSLVVKLRGLTKVMVYYYKESIYSKDWASSRSCSDDEAIFFIQKVQRNEEIDRFNIVNICIEWKEFLEVHVLEIFFRTWTISEGH